MRKNPHMAPNIRLTNWVHNLISSQLSMLPSGLFPSGFPKTVHGSHLSPT